MGDVNLGLGGPPPKYLVSDARRARRGHLQRDLLATLCDQPHPYTFCTSLCELNITRTQTLTYVQDCKTHICTMAKSRFEYVKNFELPDPLMPNAYIVVRVDGRGFHK